MLKLLIVGFDVVIVTEVHGDDDVTIPKTVHFEDESETSEDVREYRIHRKSGQKLLPVTDIPHYSYTLPAQHSFTNLTFDCLSKISQPCRRTLPSLRNILPKTL